MQALLVLLLYMMLYMMGGKLSALVAVYHLEMLWPVTHTRHESISGHPLPCVTHT